MLTPSRRLICSVIVMCPAFGSAHVATAQIRQTSFPLYYDPTNGNVTLDVSTIPTGRLGGYVVSLDPDGSSLDSDGNVVEEIPYDLDGFAIDNFTPFMGTVFYQAKPAAVGETRIEGNGIPAGVYSLGNILPVGLSPEDGALYEEVIEIDNHQTSLFGAPGSGVEHTIDFVYGKSPFPPLNVDPEEWGPPLFERWAQVVTLEYDFTSGHLLLDTTGDVGGAIVSYSLRTNGETEFFVDQWNSIDASAGTTRDSYLGEVFTAGLAEGRYDLGPVLPVGLTMTEFQDVLISRRFLGEPGHSGGPFNVEVHGEPLALAYVPEPSAAALGVILLMVSAALRRWTILKNCANPSGTKTRWADR